VALRGVPAAPGRAAIEVLAEVLRRDRQARRASIDDAADRRPVAFAEGGDEPIAGPWLSPKVVTVKSLPKELLDMPRARYEEIEA